MGKAVCGVKSGHNNGVKMFNTSCDCLLRVLGMTNKDTFFESREEARFVYL